MQLSVVQIEQWNSSSSGSSSCLWLGLLPCASLLPLNLMLLLLLLLIFVLVCWVCVWLCLSAEEERSFDCRMAQASESPVSSWQKRAVTSLPLFAKQYYNFYYNFCKKMPDNRIITLTIFCNHFLTIHQRTLIGAGIKIRKAIQFEEPSVNWAHLIQSTILIKK